MTFIVIIFLTAYHDGQSLFTSPLVPPLMGASSILIPLAVNFSQIILVLAGYELLISINTLSGLAPSIIPFGPNTKTSTSGEAGNIVITTELRPATSLGE